MKFPPRTIQFHQEVEKLCTIHNSDAIFGYFGKSEWINLYPFGYETYSILDCNDPMHDFDGIIGFLKETIQEEQLNLLKQIKTIKLTKEITGTNGNLIFIFQKIINLILNQ